MNDLNPAELKAHCERSVYDYDGMIEHISDGEPMDIKIPFLPVYMAFLGHKVGLLPAYTGQQIKFLKDYPNSDAVECTVSVPENIIPLLDDTTRYSFAEMKEKITKTRDEAKKRYV